MTTLAGTDGASLSEERRHRLRTILRDQARHHATEWPCSEGQKALWYLHQTSPESAAYNVAFSLEIHGPLNLEALRNACQGLIDRHPVLRARFQLQRGELVQTIPGYEPVRLDIQTLPEFDAVRAREHVETAYCVAFDLGEGPLYRFQLYAIASNTHVLLLTAHHIVCDGWSLWLLMDELGRLYAEFGGGRAAALPSLQATYLDYMESEKAASDGPLAAAASEYWHDQLAGELPILDLPMARPRPPAQSLRGDSVSLALGRVLTERVRQNAKITNVTPFVVMLAAYQILLYRYSGEETTLVGIPTHGNRAGAFANLAGHFVNPIVSRAVHASDEPVSEYLIRVRDLLLKAREYQEFPFPLVVNRICPHRDPSHSPIFQASFVLQRPPKDSSIFALMGPAACERRRGTWGGLTVAHYHVPQQEGQLDLSLELMDGDDDVFGSIKFDTALLDKEDVAQLALSYIEIINHIVEEPSCGVGRLRLMSPELRDRELASAGNLARRYDVSKSLDEMFVDVADRTPGEIAIVDQGTRMTYAELDDRSTDLAIYLKSRGIADQSRIGLCVERSSEMIVGIIGILKAGCAYVPLDPASPAERLKFIIEDSDIALLITQESLTDRVGQTSERTIRLDCDWAEIERSRCTGGLKEHSSPDSVAYVIYTSGTTGRPKGVEITHRNVARLLVGTEGFYHFNVHDVWPLIHSFAFDVSVWEIWGAFLHGGRLVIVPHLTVRSPDDLVDLLVSERATVLNQTPSAFRLLMKAKNLPKLANEGCLRLIIFAGEALDPQSLKPWLDLAGDEQPQLINMYGITETTVHAMYRRVRREDLDKSRSMIGVPIPDLRIYLLDSQFEPVPCGVRGEIFVGGDGLGRGYFNRPELTSARFIDDPFAREPGGRLYRSGDLACRDRSGDIEYRGRADRQVKIRGFRIELSEVEQVIGQHPSVLSVIVRVHGQGAESALAAYAVLRQAASCRPEDLREYAARSLPDYMVPVDIILLDQLPLTGNGKIDDRSLPSPRGLSSALDRTASPPRDSIEQKLLRIWQAVLKRDNLGIHDDFFAMGGHSVLAVSLIAEIEREFGIRLPIAILMRSQTISLLAPHLREASSANIWSPLVPIRVAGNGKKLFCVAGGGGNVLYFYHLARHLPPDLDFYAFQAYGLDGHSAPKATVEELASSYLDCLREVQPHGPYLLAGHCFGGWVAYEMGRQLVAAGETVEWIFVLDAPAPRRTESLSCGGSAQIDDALWLMRLGRALTEGTGVELGLNFEQLSSLPLEEGLARLGERLEEAGVLPLNSGVQQIGGLFRVFVANGTAVYDPSPEGHLRVALLRAGQFHPEYDYSPVDDQVEISASTLGWQKLSETAVAVRVVHGNHITMLCEPNVVTLATSLREFLSTSQEQ